MVGAGIQSGDVILIDRSLTPDRGSIVLAVIDGEFTVKRVDVVNDKLYLIPENPALSPWKWLRIEFQVWGCNLCNSQGVIAIVDCNNFTLRASESLGQT